MVKSENVIIRAEFSTLILVVFLLICHNVCYTRLKTSSATDMLLCLLSGLITHFLTNAINRRILQNVTWYR
jgi:hypothetical protein